MSSDNDRVLEGLAKDGSIDHALWPNLLEHLLPRLDNIAYNEFPLPTIPLPEPVALPLHSGSPLPKDSPGSQPSSQSSQKENQPTTPSEVITSIAQPSNTLPPPLVTLLNTIKSSLSTTFQNSPPHTAQRFAELLLNPTLHYRSLPSYLRALDRIVSVSSPLSAFPLATNPAASPNHGLLNGVANLEDEQEDETLSGATLTPIPWLRRDGSSPLRSTPTSSIHPHPQHHASSSDLRRESTTQIDGPNGAGSIETVTVAVNGLGSRTPTIGGTTASVATGTPVTQGELLRQEQEAGVVPVPVQTPLMSTATSQGSMTRSITSDSSSPSINAQLGMPDDAELDEVIRPHARGPELIGMEDMGPQASPAGVGGLDIEGAVGRRGEGESMLFGNNGSELDSSTEEDSHDGERQVIVTDADGIAEDGVGADASGQNVGADAADSSTVT